MEHETIEQNTASNAKRTVFIGAKVTPRQKEEIQARAQQCGMTVSNYLLARAYGYTPRARLTSEEAALLQELDGCRSDLVRYTYMSGVPQGFCILFALAAGLAVTGGTFYLSRRFGPYGLQKLMASRRHPRRIIHRRAIRRLLRIRIPRTVKP